MERDRVGAFFRERTVRRALSLLTFVALLVLFRKLLLLLVFFVAFERLLGAPAEWLGARLPRLGQKKAVLLLAAIVLGALGAGIAVGIGRGIHVVEALRHTMPDRIAAIRETALFQQIQSHLPDVDTLVENARHYASGALGWLAALGHILLYATIGFILAVVYLMEKEEIEGFVKKVDPSSLAGTLLRWFGHVADAMVVTLQFQLVVAACNAVLTLPVIFFVIGGKHVVALGLMIFLSGLVPVVGNFAAGAVLTFLAFQAKGWLGVAIFSGITFVLHKIESYYLNPRLAARHVKVPGFVLIMSLLLWEQILGFKGLFLSFPILFVAGRIRDELSGEPEIVLKSEERAA